MDWSRAKTILIITFAVLNLFLAYRLWGQPLLVDRPTGTIPAEEMSDTVTELAEMGVEIQTVIPSRIPSMATLSVAVDTKTLVEIISYYFGDKVPEAKVDHDDNTGVIRWTTGPETLELHSGGRTIFTREPLAPGEAPELDGRGVWDSTRARQVATRFLEVRGFDTSNFVVEDALYDEANETYVVRFFCEYQSWVVYSQVAAVTVGHWGVLMVEFVPLQFGPFGSDRQRVIPATEILLLWAREHAAAGSTEVTLLALGYRTVDDQTALPVWRIGTEGGTTYYLNAYTGDLMWYGRGL